MPARSHPKKPVRGEAPPTSPKRLTDLPAYAEDPSLVHVVIETPKGSPNKLDYDPALGALRLKKVLPKGLAFPFDFGFIPSTRAEDGDPEDVLLLIEDPLPAGVIVPARLIGVIEAVQTEREGEPVQNDRLLAVAPACPLYADVHTLSDLPKAIIDQIEHFFVTYNAEEGKTFTVQDRHGARRASKCLQRSLKRYAHQAMA